MSESQVPNNAPQAAANQPQSAPSKELAKPEAPKEQSGALELSEEDLALITGDAPKGEEAEVAAAEKKLADAKGKEAKAEAQRELEKVKRKYKLKVDGREEEWEGTDEDLVKELQLAKKARKEIQNSASIKKEVAEFLQALKTNPAAVLADPAIGVDVLEFAKQIINKQIEDELKSPEQLEKERLERELEDLREQAKREKEEREREEYERLLKQAEADIEEKVQEALETSGLPKSPYVLKRMADVMQSVLESGKDISPKQAMNIVKREMKKDLGEFFTSSPDDLLEELLGNDNIKRINKRQLERVKKKAVETASSIKDTGAAADLRAEQKKQPEKKMKISEWLKGKG